MIQANLNIDDALNQIRAAQSDMDNIPTANADETLAGDSANEGFVGARHLSDDTYRPFPVDALPPVMRNLALQIERVKCVDPVTPVLPMLSVAGACVGNTRRAMMSNDFYSPPVIWSAGVLPSGERKSPVLNAVMFPLYQRQIELAQQHGQEINEYRKAHKEWKNTAKDRRGDEPEPPGEFPHLYLTDTTVEAIAVRLMVQPRGLICVHDELAGWFKSFNSYKKNGNDRESYLAFFDASPAKIDRKISDPPTIVIPRAFIAVTGMIQPAILRAALSESDFANGMVARFLFAAPPPRQAVWVSGGIPSEVRDAWRDVLHRLMGLIPGAGNEPIPLRLTSAAMGQWIAAHDRMGAQMFRSGDDRERAALSKLIGYIPRIALVLQLTSWASGERGAGDEEIDEKSLRRAVELVAWFAHETRRIYGIFAESDDDAERRGIIDLIERRGGQITARELHRARRQFASTDDAEVFLNELVDAGIGRWLWPGGMGRPSRVFHLDRTESADESLKHQRNTGLSSALHNPEGV